MRGDNMSAVQWVSKCRGGREPRSGAFMRLLGCLEVGSGSVFDALHVAGVENTITDGISRWEPEDISARSCPMLLGTDRYWGQRASRYASECWRPGHS